MTRSKSKTKELANNFSLRVVLKKDSVIRQFICFVCRKAFKQQFFLDAHLKIRHSVAEIKIGKIFIKGTNHLQNIRLRHTNADKFFNCDECGKKFSWRFRLNFHLQMEHLKKALFWYRQNRKRYSYASYRFHSMKHSVLHEYKPTVKCKICEQTFSNKKSLYTHELSHATGDGERPYQCPECFKYYVSQKSLKAHVRLIHRSACLPRPFECRCCGKRFRFRSRLAAHASKHSDEKPFICKMCGKGFVKFYTLDIHQKAHLGEKPWQCKECNKSFLLKEYLKAHMRTHTGEKPFPCVLCGMKFRYSDTLTSHMRSHTGERPFKCFVCGKGFTRSYKLTVHMRTHTGERPYKCMVCTKGFMKSGGLNRHMLIHTDDKPFICEMCGRGFRLKSQLNKHKSLHAKGGL